MPKKKVTYLVHDLCDMTQIIMGGQRNLLSYMGSIGCRIDKNSLKTNINNPEVDIQKLEHVLVSDEGHWIVIEELFE